MRYFPLCSGVLLIGFVWASLGPTAMSQAATPTPTPSPSPTVTSAATTQLPPEPGELWINEIIANPSGSDTGNEWLELFNPTDHPLDISGIKVNRLSGSTLHTVATGSILPAGAYLQLTKITGSIVNSSDTLLLLHGTTELDRVSYDALGPEGWSWSRRDATAGEWVEDITPGAANVFSPDVAATPGPAVDPSPLANPAQATTATASSATTKTSTAKAATTKKTTSPKSKTATAKAKSLPAGGPDLLLYVIPLAFAALAWYSRCPHPHHD